MNTTYYLQTAVGLIAGGITCAAWWYAALKFPRTWIFSGLAIVCTISILFYAGMVLLFATGNRSGFAFQLSTVQVILHLIEAVFLVVLVRWLIVSLKEQNKL